MGECDQQHWHFERSNLNLELPLASWVMEDSFWPAQDQMVLRVKVMEGMMYVTIVEFGVDRLIRVLPVSQQTLSRFLCTSR